MDPGGTANLAVLGGNLPPSFSTARAPAKSCIPGAPGAGGSRPPQLAGGPFHPDLYCIVPTLVPSTGVTSETSPDRSARKLKSCPAK